MHINLAGRTAVVTGSTAGIGFAIAQGLIRAGARVVVNGRTQARVDAAVAALGHEYAVGCAADLSQPESLSRLIATAPAADILINSLALFERKAFGEICDDEWRRYFEVNVMTGMRLARHYLPGMTERKWGRVIFIASTAAVSVPPDLLHYSVTKTAVVALARGLANTVAGTGVTVNTILPGLTRTEGFNTMFDHEAQRQGRDVTELETEFVAGIAPHSLIRRMAEPHEVANLVVYLASDQACVSTGGAYRVDGGLLANIF
jgi:NAD(P)-dependent dehydrogenase (short-subunit alcohol dehydrogenase family)